MVCIFDGQVGQNNYINQFNLQIRIYLPIRILVTGRSDISASSIAANLQMKIYASAYASESYIITC